MEQPLISVIIPVYRVEDCLDRCMETVVHQTYQNLDIILVDDGSPDRCPQLCDAWAERDRRIRVIHKPNGGLSDARNCGLRAARGTYVAFVDSDDWISLVMLERMQQAMESYGVDMVMCQFVHVRTDGSQAKHTNAVFPAEVLSARDAVRLLLQDGRVTNHVWRKLYKRALVPPDVFPVGRCYEDVCVMDQLFLRCRTVLYLDDALYFYRDNPRGIVSSRSIAVMRDHLEAFQLRRERLRHVLPGLEDALDRSTLEAAFYIWLDLKETREDTPERDALRAALREELTRPGFGRVCRLIPGFWRVKTGLLLIKWLPWLEARVGGPLCLPNGPGDRFFKGLRAFLRTLRRLYRLRRDRPAHAFWLFGTPTHGNLGDRALSLAEEQFIARYFPTYPLRRVPLEGTGRFTTRLLAGLVRPGDICAIHAGGNIGTLYPDIHAAQERMIYALRHKRFVVFPQTLYYSPDAQGAQALQRTRKVYRACRHLRLFVRERESCTFLRTHLPEVPCALMPDMALFLPAYVSGRERAGALAILRTDSERTLSDHACGAILTLLEQRFGRVEDADTHVYRDLSEDQVRTELARLWDRMSAAQAVVTDRLHGMIFAAITQTPCVLLPGRSHKLEGVFQWVEPLPYLQLARSADEVPAALDRALAAERPVYNPERFRTCFDRLAEQIRDLQRE